jgi:thioredoxin 1
MASTFVIPVNEQNFEEEVLKSDKLVLIDFYADWCGPCKALAPTLEKFAEENQDKVKVVKINVDESPNLAGAFNVRSIPTLVTMKGNEAIFGVTGGVPKNVLEQLVDQSLQAIAANDINKGGKPAAPSGKKPDGKGPTP